MLRTAETIITLGLVTVLMSAYVFHVREDSWEAPREEE